MSVDKTFNSKFGIQEKKFVKDKSKFKKSGPNWSDFFKKLKNSWDTVFHFWSERTDFWQNFSVFEWVLIKVFPSGSLEVWRKRRFANVGQSPKTDLGSVRIFSKPTKIPEHDFSFLVRQVRFWTKFFGFRMTLQIFFLQLELWKKFLSMSDKKPTPNGRKFSKIDKNSWTRFFIFCPTDPIFRFRIPLER
jgi:hypothetical protein